MIFYISLYLIPGMIWAGFLEYYTTQKLEGELAKDWSWPERLFHCIMWPLSLTIFIIAFIQEIKNHD